LPDQLADRILDRLLVQPREQAVLLQSIMSTAAHAFAAASAEHVHDVGGAERSSELAHQSEDRTSEEVSTLRRPLRLQAEVARAAVFRVVRLTQVAHQPAVPADLRSAEI